VSPKEGVVGRDSHIDYQNLPQCLMKVALFEEADLHENFQIRMNEHRNHPFIEPDSVNQNSLTFSSEPIASNLLEPLWL
jgi:hypothetical protein